MIEAPVLERIGILGSTDRIKGYMIGVLNRLLEPRGWPALPNWRPSATGATHSEVDGRRA